MQRASLDASGWSAKRKLSMNGLEEINRDFLEADFDTNVIESALDVTVAVGTTITDRPPAQIRTSASTHMALTKDGWRSSRHRDRGAERGVEESTDLRLG